MKGLLDYIPDFEGNVYLLKRADILKAPKMIQKNIFHANYLYSKYRTFTKISLY